MANFFMCVVVYCVVLFYLAESKLLLLHVLFRHGEKIANRFQMYPSDPYKNETFFPYEAGQLTNEGKRTIYNLGKILRHRYDTFLDELYQPSHLSAWTSSYGRCQSSLQIILATLYPPKGISIWQKNFNWQPIPYNFLDMDSDDMFLGVFKNDFLELYYSYLKTAEGKRAMDEYRPVLAYIQNHTKLQEITSLREILFLQDLLFAEEHYGLVLPEWTEEVYPRPMRDMVHVEYHQQMKTSALRKIVIGKMMKKILDDSENRIKSANTNCKIHIYSGHDFNIVHWLIFLGLMYKHYPGYGACLVLELHEEHGNHFIEVRYRDDEHSKFALLHFPGGEKRIHFHHFRRMVEQLTNEEIIVEKVSFNGAIMHMGCLRIINTCILLYFSRSIW